jgi:hypothetical protein
MPSLVGKGIYTSFKTAKIKAMRKLVHLCFGVWKNQTPYQADFLPKTA